MRCGSPPPPLFISTYRPLKCFLYHQIVLVQTASLAVMSVACCSSPDESVLTERSRQQQVWLSRAVRAARRGTFIHQVEVKYNRDSKCKVDKWLITTGNEMIHHFIKLSSLKDYLEMHQCRHVCCSMRS